jgi:hypothetical protein
MEYSLTHDGIAEELWPDLSKAEWLEWANRFMASPEFEVLPVHDYAYEAVQALRDLIPEALLISVSSVPEMAAMLTARRMQLSPFGFDAVHTCGFAQPKAAVLQQFGADILFDDSPAQVEAAEAAGIRTIVVRRRWNKDFAHSPEIYDWRDAPRIVAELLRRDIAEAA